MPAINHLNHGNYENKIMPDLLDLGVADFVLFCMICGCHRSDRELSHFGIETGMNHDGEFVSFTKLLVCGLRRTAWYS